MNDILQAKVRQLEKQLDLFTSIAHQQQLVLHDVYFLLDQHGNSPLSAVDVEKMKRRVEAALAHAARPTETSGQWSPERASQVHQQLGSYVIPYQSIDLPRGQESAKSCQNGSVMTVAATNASERILTCVRSLLAVWLEHLGRKVDCMLEEPQDKFRCFQDFPAEDTLTAFMDAFATSSEQLKHLITVARNECDDRETHQRKREDGHGGPAGITTGNPFACASTEETRLLQLFQDTVLDEVACVAVANSDTNHSQKTAVEPCSEGELPHNFAALPTVSDVKQRPLEKIETTGGKRKPPLPFSRPPSVDSGRPTPSQETDFAHFARPTSSAAAPSPSVATTPRRQNSSAPPHRSNDSSQIWSALGAEPTRNPGTPRGAAPAVGGGAVVGPSDRLKSLNAVLQQLEFQLAGVAMSGRNSGSEAKYYALSKKLQKVRADIVREQRELNEIRTAEQERLSLRVEKEEHRRMFHR
jgi:hypothetical protein